MSLIKTALVTALLASSSVAFADTGVSFSASAQYSYGTPTAPMIRDHRTTQLPAPVYTMPPPKAATWSLLSSSLQLRDGMDVINVQGRQSVSQLRLEAISGNSQIDRVMVRFMDHTRQVISVRNVLSNQSPMMQLDLQANSSGVESITIIGHGGRRASYQVLVRASRLEQLPVRPVVNFAGTYSSAYGAMSFEQTGNRIHGTYGSGGTIDGYVDQGIAIVNWSEPGSTGRATFWVGANGKVEGTWGNGASTNDAGEWDLVRKLR